MLTLRVSLHLAVICVNTLVFTSSVKYLYGVTSFTHMYMPRKRDFLIGEKREHQNLAHMLRPGWVTKNRQSIAATC